MAEAQLARGAGPGWSQQRRVGEVAVVLAACVAVAAGIVFLLSAWTPFNPVADTDLQTYGLFPDDGLATRSVLRSAQGGAQVGTSTRRLTVAQASAQWPIEARVGLFALGEEPDGADPVERAVAFETVTTTAADSGAVTRRTTFTVVTPRGVHVVATSLDGDPTVHTFDPPLLTRPAALSVGATWGGEGSFGVASTYRFSGKVLPLEPVNAGLGSYPRCVVVEELLELGPGQASGVAQRAYACPDVGEVLRRSADGAAELELVATTRLADALPQESPARVARQPQAPARHALTGAPAEWELSEVGAVEGRGVAAGPNFPPVVLAGEEPSVVAQSAGGPLVAVDASDAATGVRWRFHSGLNVGGSLDQSEDGSTLLLGTTDGTVYAVDRDGMLRWAKQAGDAVTGVTAGADGAAVFVSEDRTVTAVAADGSQRWRAEAGGPVSGRPGVGRDSVVVASEDGAIRIIAAATGRTRTRIDLDDRISADVTVHDDVALVATTGGLLVAVDVRDGTVRWRVHAGGEVTAGAAVVQGQVGVVAGGRYVSFDTSDATPVGRSVSTGYVGAPAAVDGGVLLARADGAVDLLSPDGTVLRSWAVAADDAAFTDGPVLGSGAAWISDSQGRLYRLGVRRPGDRPAIGPRWSRDLADPALLSSGAVPAYPAVAAPDGSAVLIDFLGGVQLVDPASGSLRSLGRIEAVEDPAGGVLLHDDVLVVATRVSLHAVTFPELEPLWTLPGLGGSAGAPTLAGDTVLWASGAASRGGGDLAPPARLHAIDLRSGQIRWESRPADAVVAAGVAVSGEVVFAAHELAAYDLATGKQRWSLPGPRAGLGRPAVSPDGRHIAVGTITLEGAEQASLLIVDAETGAVVRTVGLPDGAAVDPSDEIRWLDEAIVVSQLNGAVAGFSPDGSLQWTYRPPLQRFGDVGLAGDALWLELADGRVVVVAALTGEVIARDVAGDERLDVTSATSRPVDVRGHIIVADGQRVRGYAVAELP